MSRAEIKSWVVKTASVSRPYGGNWSASVTLGVDISEDADTIEKAYCKLTARIALSPYLRTKLESL